MRIVLVGLGALSREVAGELWKRGFEVETREELGSLLALPAILVLGPAAAHGAELANVRPYQEGGRPIVVVSNDPAVADRVRFVTSGPVLHVLSRGSAGELAAEIAAAAQNVGETVRPPELPTEAETVRPPTDPSPPPTAAPSPGAGPDHRSPWLLAGTGCAIVVAAIAVAVVLVVRAGSAEPGAPPTPRPASVPAHAFDAGVATPEPPPSPVLEAPPPAGPDAVVQAQLAAARSAHVGRDSRESDHLVDVAGHAIDRHELAEAQEMLDRALALDPDNPQAWAALGRLHTAKGEPEIGARWLELAVDMRYPRTRYHVWLGDARHAAGDERGARRAWERALRQDPDNAEIAERLSRETPAAPP